MTQTFILLMAVILIAIRLPSVMRRVEIKGGEKIGFVLIIFALLGIAWLAVHALGVLF